MKSVRTSIVVAASVLTLASACGSSDDSASRTVVEVESTADACELSIAEAAAGDFTFTVHNGGDEATEFYLYEANGTDIVAEVENIGPGLSRDMKASLAAGKFVTACKPGMTGDGIRGDFTVSGE